MFNQAPFLGQVRLRPAIGCGMMPLPYQDEEVQYQEPSQMLGCDEHRRPQVGCAKCRRKKKPDWTLGPSEPINQEPSEMIGVHRTRRILIGDARHPHYMGQVCPAPGGSADPANFGPDVACQMTQSGDIICSNNVIYSGGCPHAPKPNVPGVAANMPGTSVPQAPAPLSAGAAPAATTAPAAMPAAAPATTASSALPTVGIVAGGAAIAGLAYLLFMR